MVYAVRSIPPRPPACPFWSCEACPTGWGRARRETTIDELETVADPDAEAHATDDALDRSLTTQAFRSLPSRWQEVLWYTEIEQMKPAEIAPLLGMMADRFGVGTDGGWGSPTISYGVPAGGGESVKCGCPCGSTHL